MKTKSRSFIPASGLLSWSVRLPPSDNSRCTVTFVGLEPSLRQMSSTRDTACSRKLRPPSSNEARIRNSVGPTRSMRLASRGVPPSPGIDQEIPLCRDSPGPAAGLSSSAARPCSAASIARPRAPERRRGVTGKADPGSRNPGRPSWDPSRTTGRAAEEALPRRRGTGVCGARPRSRLRHHRWSRRPSSRAAGSGP